MGDFGGEVGAAAAVGEADIVQKEELPEIAGKCSLVLVDFDFWFVLWADLSVFVVNQNPIVMQGQIRKVAKKTELGGRRTRNCGFAAVYKQPAGVGGARGDATASKVGFISP